MKIMETNKNLYLKIITTIISNSNCFFTNWLLEVYDMLNQHY